jgi:hypothetical protein
VYSHTILILKIIREQWLRAQFIKQAQFLQTLWLGTCAIYRKRHWNEVLMHILNNPAQWKRLYITVFCFFPACTNTLKTSQKLFPYDYQTVFFNSILNVYQFLRSFLNVYISVSSAAVVIIPYICGMPSQDKYDALIELIVIW